MKEVIKLPPHLQELVKKIDENNKRFESMGFEITEIDCDEIFKDKK